jgi:opacity protein-like surface antigen
MKRLLALASVAAALAPASASAAPVVPVFTQHQILRRAPAVAYVPARGAIGWRYRNWRVQAGVLRIWFASRTEPRKVIVFSAAPFHGSCRAGMEKSFQMAGIKVWYSHTGTQQQSWRCVNGVKLVASTTMPPTRFADVGLGRIAASGHRIR